MSTIGEKIKELRKKKGVSQEETAYELGVSRQTVSKWESGLMQPNAESIKALSEYFEVTPECFFGDTQAAEETAVSQAVPVKNKRKTAFIICLVLLIISVIAFIALTYGTVGNAIIASSLSSDPGFDTVSDFSMLDLIGCIIGSIISLGAIVGLVAALIKLRK